MNYNYKGYTLLNESKKAHNIQVVFLSSRAEKTKKSSNSMFFFEDAAKKAGLKLLTIDPSSSIISKASGDDYNVVEESGGSKKTFVINPTNTIIVSDTIINIVYDTVYLERYKTVKLPITDTLYRDSVKIDSVFVEVPISTYKLDTVFKTDTTRLDLHIINSGFDVKLESLYYRLEYKPSPVKLPKKNYWNNLNMN